MRIFFVFNICLWFVLFLAWTPYTSMMGLADPTSMHVAFILFISAVLLTFQGYLRYRRARRRLLT